MKNMPRTLIPLHILILTVLFGTYVANAQKPIILEGEPPLNRNINLVQNGSFETPHLTDGGKGFVFYDGIDGDGYYYFSSGTVLIPFAEPHHWTTTGGGTRTYAIWGNNFEEISFLPILVTPEYGIAYSDPNIHGNRALYFGNSYIESISETPTFESNGEVTFPNPPIIVLNPDYGTGVTLTQTVTRLIPGETYRLSFWTSSEWASSLYADGSFVRGDGIFGLQIEDHELLYLTIPAGAGGSAPREGTTVFGADESHTYLVEFVATQEEMDISFINWGHFAFATTAGWNRADTTELVMDDVILNRVGDDAAVIPTASEWGLIFMTVFMGLIAVYMLRRRNGGREGVGV